MGQLFSYIRRCLRPNNTKTLQNDQFPPSEDYDQSYYITIPDDDPVQPEEVTTEAPFVAVNVDNYYMVDEQEEEEDEEEEVVEKVIQVVVTNEASSQVQVLAMPTSPIEEHCVSKNTVCRIGQYSSSQRILLVGEGDFSFSTSLAIAFGSASNIIATSLDTQEFLTKHYKKFLKHKRELESRGCVVIHGVDATKMIRHSVLGNMKFDCIIYNFPHAGCFGRSDADVWNLVRGFVRNAKKMINEDGEIHITHKSNKFFRQWDIPKIGCDEGVHLIEAIRFKRSMYPGYHTMLGFGGNRYFHCNPSKTYKFALPPPKS